MSRNEWKVIQVSGPFGYNPDGDIELLSDGKMYTLTKEFNYTWWVEELDESSFNYFVSNSNESGVFVLEINETTGETNWFQV